MSSYQKLKQENQRLLGGIRILVGRSSVDKLNVELEYQLRFSVEDVSAKVSSADFNTKSNGKIVKLKEI